ncbi:MAG: hypothetical protein C7B43_17780 [Sulfobacillus benefaciens]|uniref:TRASH domain-containing protein n=1 Tax=Sulfobacillus benefaciens TaxID=453960 RepID=A0A2T2WS14_9FIRM|nr:MAG: hypothetical protein C7B43_17780 [Sulfobacillus benefaciens]
MATAVDVVCHMNVEVQEETPHVDYQGERYYFCCAACAKAFEQNPSQYIP